MALLKLTSTLLLLAASMTIAGQNPNFEKQRTAFRNSYISEKVGDYGAAAQYLKEIYTESSYEINLRLGWLQYNQGNYPEAESYYRKAVALMPYGLEARFGLLYPLSYLGNANQIIEVYNQILEIDPNNSIALYRYGLFLYNREDFLRAEKMVTKVVNLYPFDFDGVVLLAWIKLKLGKLLEARALFQKALLFKPDDGSAIIGLSRIK